MPFESIELVTGGFTLVAFIVACVAWLVMAGINRDRDLISHASDERKSALVEKAMGRFSIDANGLTKQQKYDLLIQSMMDRRRFWSKLFVFLILLSVLAAGLTISIFDRKVIDDKEVSYLESENFKKAQQSYFFLDNDKEAARLYEQEAELGNPYAQAALAKLYFKGWGVKKDEEKAHYWGGLSVDALTKLLEQDDEWAHYSLGFLYSEGVGLVQDKERAFQHYKKASLRNNWVAQNNLASFYRNGDHVEKDVGKAIDLYKASIQYSNKKYMTAFKNLGDMYYYEEYGVKDYNLALENYLKASELGSDNAMDNVANMYAYGLGVEKNLETAFEWYLKAAQKGNQNAKFQVARAYVGGLGVKKDLSEGVRVYRELAKADNSAALSNLGVIYKFGDVDPSGFSIEKNLNKAIGFFKKSAELGDDYAPGHLGDIYFNGGQEINPNYEMAFNWYQLSAERGRSYGKRRLAGMYEDGLYVEKNIEKARSLYKEATEQGDVSAMVYLGDLYRLNQKPDLKLAFKWYQKAAETGEAVGLNAMGKAYAHGWGVEFDHEISKEYFLKAVEKSYSSAMWQLGQLYLHKDWDQYSPEKAHEWHYKAAMADNSCGMNSVGYNYLEGRGVKQDNAEAKTWFEKASKHQSAALYNLARIYEHGLGVNVDLEQAFSFYQQAEKKGHRASGFGVYRVLSNKNYSGYDPLEAQFALSKAAKQGEPQALETIKSKIASYDKPLTCDMPLVVTN